jgi:cytochrome c
MSVSFIKEVYFRLGYLRTMNTGRLAAAFAFAVALPLQAGAADGGAQLAADRGCYNCHGEPARRNVPSFRELVARYAVYGGKPDAATEQKLVDRMHHGSMFSHVAAHERHSEEDARALVRWLVAGGR